ncbi:MAG: hypothetical protein NZ954_01260 [Thermofilaceae archaeon]|nr:hypothetical protein [Thermofilaceae archaeon]MCX8180502.1 hypothetical protein [Thermofilaceae archaeon]MDW8003301.1 hypothetical protein [Thermofilaceae archaeon]
MEEPSQVTIIGDVESYDETTGKHRWVRLLGWGPGLGYPLWSGYYKLVYGIPRLLVDPENPEKPIFEAYEIEGEFDADTVSWTRGKMKVKYLETGEISVVEVENWRFSLYEGDKLYTDDGRLLFQVLKKEKKVEK